MATVYNLSQFVPVTTPGPPVTSMTVHVPAKLLYLNFVKCMLPLQNSVPFRSCSQEFSCNSSTLKLAKLSQKTQLRTPSCVPSSANVAYRSLYSHFFFLNYHLLYYIISWNICLFPLRMAYPSSCHPSLPISFEIEWSPFSVSSFYLSLLHILF